MDLPIILSAVEAELFNDRGKWKYTVKLDYRYRGAPAGYVDANENARRALAEATANGTSEVRLSRVPPGWFLVVPQSPEGFPVMVIGEPE